MNDSINNTVIRKTLQVKNGCIWLNSDNKLHFTHMAGFTYKIGNKELREIIMETLSNG